MESAFTWLSQFFETVMKFVPHLKVVRATHGGVKFRRGKKILEIKPGLCWYWPITTEIDVIPVARQTNNLPTQGAVTKDRVAVAFSTIAVYKIVDPVAALSRNWDFNDTIKDVTMTVILPIILKHDYDELIRRIADETIQKELTRMVRARLRKYGVSVSFVGLTDFTKAMALNHIGNSKAF